MHLLIGLGNPGSDYAGNRHNIGFMAVDAIAEAHGFSKWKKAHGGMIAEGTVDGRKLLLLKPLTYMNLSGEAAGACARFHKIPTERIVAIHDELDLPFGKLRVKTGGGHGGHNGLKSLDAHLGKDYKRLRLGIGHPGDKDLVSDYVLSDFAKAERKPLKAWLAAVAAHAGLLVAGDDAGFMNKLTSESRV